MKYFMPTYWWEFAREPCGEDPEFYSDADEMFEQLEMEERPFVPVEAYVECAS